jgi:aminoglycoside phosphotransferase
MLLRMARVTWGELPREVRGWAERSLGSAVVAADSMAGGFSPGAACRLRLASGERAFLKAVSAAANPTSPGFHRREARIAAALPDRVPVPRFRDVLDTGDWVALLFDDAGGRPPAQPWQEDELKDVVAALRRLHESLTPAPPGMMPASKVLRPMLNGWRELSCCAPAAEADSWWQRNLDRLAELESGWDGACAGDTLLHCDLRADNVLLTAGGVVFVDWPSACVGAGWFDVVAFAPSVEMDGGPQPETVLAWYGADVPREALTAAVAGIAGYFTHRARMPAPPGLPTLRAFQEAQGVPARAWLKRLTGWS